MAFFWRKVQKTTTPPPPKGHFLTICFFCLRASWPQAYAVWSVINEWRWWCCCERKDDLWELSIIIDNVMAFLSFSHLKLFGQNEQTWKKLFGWKDCCETPKHIESKNGKISWEKTCAMWNTLDKKNCSLCPGPLQSLTSQSRSEPIAI